MNKQNDYLKGGYRPSDPPHVLLKKWARINFHKENIKYMKRLAKRYGYEVKPM